MTAETIVARDVYLRYDGGRVQHFRAWDAARLVESQIAQGRDAKPPYVVTIATEAEFAQERAR